MLPQVPEQHKEGAGHKGGGLWLWEAVFLPGKEDGVALEVVQYVEVTCFPFLSCIWFGASFQ